MAVDYGERRIGVALSDATGILASPLPTLTRRSGKRAPFPALCEIARQHDVGAVIIGLPLKLSGEENDWCAEVRQFGADLARRLDVPVHFQDERLTSVRAERAIRGSGLPRSQRERKDRVDAGAAALILQAWLDRRTAELRLGGPPS